jgi:hypothetical protein
MEARMSPLVRRILNDPDATEQRKILSNPSLRRDCTFEYKGKRYRVSNRPPIELLEENKKMKKHKIILLVVMVYISIVSLIGRFANPELSETQLFFRIPHFVVLDF